MEFNTIQETAQAVCDCSPAVNAIFQKTQVFIVLMFIATFVVIVSMYLKKFNYIDEHTYNDYILKPAVMLYIGGSSFLFSYMSGV